MKLAIVGGISEYQYQTQLKACENDALTMRTFLEKTETYSDICFLGRETTGTLAKKNISDFIQKHRGTPVSELLFYFSGHGDRADDDFFYAFSDYRTEKRESTGLRNTELDSLIRNLAPELTVKIVDACYSGSTYIKSDDDIGPVVQKSANDNQLKKLYFFHSSAADQTSLAGPQFSWFTQAILQSLVNQTGAVRYRDLIASVADEMNQKGGPRPTFVVQADSLEIFVNMDASLISLLSNALASPTSPTIDGKDLVDTHTLEEISGQPQLASGATVSLATLAAIKAKDVFCTQDEAEQNIQQIFKLVDIESWPDQIKNAYDIQFREQEPSEMPNKVAIGRWISNIKEDTIFAVPLFDTETYKIEEYKELPKKPSNTAVARNSSLDYLFGINRLRRDEKEYKLETVEKKRQVLSGFEYSVNPIFHPHIFHFQPKFASLETYAACVVFLFSRRLLTCLYSVEHLPYRAWNAAGTPRAREWKQHSAPLKNTFKIEELTRAVMQEIVDYIETDARQRLA